VAGGRQNHALSVVRPASRDAGVPVPRLRFVARPGIHTWVPAAQGVTASQGELRTTFAIGCSLGGVQGVLPGRQLLRKVLITNRQEALVAIRRKRKPLAPIGLHVLVAPIGIHPDHGSQVTLRDNLQIDTDSPSFLFQSACARFTVVDMSVARSAPRLPPRRDDGPNFHFSEGQLSARSSTGGPKGTLKKHCPK
jgi:hypothetical protein